MSEQTPTTDTRGLVERLRSNQQHERHATARETAYWCAQWRLLAEQAIAALSSSPAPEPATTHHFVLGREMTTCGLSLWTDGALARTEAVARVDCAKCRATLSPAPETPETLVALKAAAQFLDPVVPRGQGVAGWRNTVNLVEEVIAKAEAAPPETADPPLPPKDLAAAEIDDTLRRVARAAARAAVEEVRTSVVEIQLYSGFGSASGGIFKSAVLSLLDGVLLRMEQQR